MMVFGLLDYSIRPTSVCRPYGLYVFVV